MIDGEKPSDDDGRVVSFRRGQAHARPRPPDQTPVEDLAKYQDRESPDDYRNRMIVNVAAFLFVAGLIGAGIWLAETMAQMRKDQGYVLSGRRGCTPVEVPQQRW